MRTTVTLDDMPDEILEELTRCRRQRGHYPKSIGIGATFHNMRPGIWESDGNGSWSWRRESSLCD